MPRARGTKREEGIVATELSAPPWLVKSATFRESFPLVEADIMGFRTHPMKSLLPLIFAGGLISCVHTAAFPMATPAGEPVVLRVPGVAKGAAALPSQLLAIDEKLLAGVTPETLVWRYFPDLEGKTSAEVALMGIVGDVETQSGRVFHAYLPIVVLRAKAPAARVEAAAARMAVDLHARAEKIGEVLPLSQLADPEAPAARTP